MGKALGKCGCLCVLWAHIGIGVKGCSLSPLYPSPICGIGIGIGVKHWCYTNFSQNKEWLARVEFSCYGHATLATPAPWQGYCMPKRAWANSQGACLFPGHVPWRQGRLGWFGAVKACTPRYLGLRFQGFGSHG